MSDKTRKYFFYAIGEIFLVVIGILIALQVNNWNEQLKAEKLSTKYKAQLLTDLERDTTYINEYLDDINRGRNRWKALKLRLSSDEANLDSVIHINKNEFNFFLNVFIGFNNDTYRAIEATGNWDVFEDDFVKDITRHYRNKETINDYIRIEFENVYLKQLYDHNLSYPIDQPFIMLSEGPLSEYIWNTIDKREFLVSFNEITTAQATYFRWANLQLGSALRQTQEILDKYYN